MGFQCAVDGNHYDCKPVLVVTEQREVTYLNNSGTSKGVETIREVKVHPDNVDVLGPSIVIEMKSLDRCTKQRRSPSHHNSNISPKNEQMLNTWKDYQKEQRK